MQIINKCSSCGSEHVDVVLSKFTKSIKTVQGDRYKHNECKVLFVCTDCGDGGESSFHSLEKIIRTKRSGVYGS